jgi:hypothetical protein
MQLKVRGAHRNIDIKGDGRKKYLESAQIEEIAWQRHDATSEQ